jgi:hypothetical protein
MLHRLGIGEGDFDDAVFEEIEDAPKEGLKWMALVRVQTTNYFSASTFEQHMRVAWSPCPRDQIPAHRRKYIYSSMFLPRGLDKS